MIISRSIHMPNVTSPATATSHPSLCRTRLEKSASGTRELQTMVAQKSELEGIKASISSIEKQSAQHEFLKEFIEQTYGASFASIRTERYGGVPAASTGEPVPGV